MNAVLALNSPAVPCSVPLIGILRQLAGLLEQMTDKQYGVKPEGFFSSIGGHVRHCLDHIDSVLAACEYGRLDYDNRRRGTDIEVSRHAALKALARQENHLLVLSDHVKEQTLRLMILLDSTLPPFELGTTIGRELAFVLSHTIHHNALIAVMAKALGIPLPERFGYAPSTIAHLEKTSCAQ